MVSRRTRVASWIFRRDHPSRPNAMICCFFSSFKTFAMLREATYPPAAVNVLDVSSESMAAFRCSLRPQIFLLLPLLARPHRHAPILQTKPVDTSTLSAHESELAPRAASRPRPAASEKPGEQLCRAALLLRDTLWHFPNLVRLGP